MKLLQAVTLWRACSHATTALIPLSTLHWTLDYQYPSDSRWSGPIVSTLTVKYGILNSSIPVAGYVVETVSFDTFHWQKSHNTACHVTKFMYILPV